MSLPPGWYPHSRAEIENILAPFDVSDTQLQGKAQIADNETAAIAVIAPHAGWHYSGTPAAIAVSALARNADTVAVIGGHLPAEMPMLIAAADAAETPLGVMEIDRELGDVFAAGVSCRDDRYGDNTVEVLLPMVHYFFPAARLLWFRFPANISSYEAGKKLAETANELRRSLVVIASADLTHYGAAYGFCPRGKGKAALDWVKNVNDAAFLRAVIEGDAQLVLHRAEADFSCCSAGAVVGAMGFASAMRKEIGGTEKSPRRFDSRLKAPQILDYRTSADVSDMGDDDVPDSFVGYAAMAWQIPRPS